MSWSIETTPGEHQRGSLSGIEDRGVSIRSDLAGSLIASGAARSNRDRLLAGEALCVTTGQQPGLLTGPVMTIHKAVSAVSVAERLTESMRRPVVPVFWVAGDDHDFDEVNHLHLISPANEVETVRLRARDSGAPAVPMNAEAVGDEIRAVFDRVSGVTPPTEFRDAMLDLFRQHYAPERSMATSFAHLMADLLGDLGVVVFEPYSHEAKRASVAVMRSAIERDAEIRSVLLERNERLQSAGKPVPVPVLEDHTMLMMIGAQGRDRILADGRQLHLRRSGERFERDELLEFIEDEPWQFSPNVLLRPIAEAQLLPTVAYIAGPTEAAYWAQVHPVFELLGTTAPRVLLRWSGRVVEQRVLKVLAKYDLSMDDLALAEGQLESRLVRDQLPDDVNDTLRDLRSAIDKGFRDLVTAATRIEPTLEKPVLGAQNHLYGQLDHIERKIVTQLKGRNEVLMRQVSAARTSLFPLQKPQERVVNVLQYLIRYGPEYLDGVTQACRAWAADLESPATVT
jgi:bacillithiol biosynthesis cysteine-adding enzyme BshC